MLMCVLAKGPTGLLSKVLKGESCGAAGVWYEGSECMLRGFMKSTPACPLQMGLSESPITRVGLLLWGEQRAEI